MAQSNFIKVNGKWQHKHVGGVFFNQKPPEWIGPYLALIAEKNYSLGREHALALLKEVFEEILEG